MPFVALFYQSILTPPFLTFKKFSKQVKEYYHHTAENESEAWGGRNLTESARSFQNQDSDQCFSDTTISTHGVG